MKIYHILLIALLSPFRSACQEINCDDFFLDNGLDEIITRYERQPAPQKGFKEFYNSLSGAFKQDTDTVFVRFVVDTLGVARCIEVVKSNNEDVGAEVVNIIRDTMFMPATQRGKEINAPMVLPLFQGKFSNIKHKAKKRQHAH